MITIDQLQFAWDKSEIINIPQLQIKQGEHLFIEGPSGSGKSTLLNLIAGVVSAQQGDINILGQSLKGLTASQKDSFRADHIGFIFQQFNLIPYLSVLDNITLPCSFSPRRRNNVLSKKVSLEQEALRLLKALGIDDPDLIQRSVNELSVGQQQRVAAARAILGSPEIIIADEPTSALDAEHRQAFIQLLFDECKNAGITLIFVSHDPALKALFAQSINLPEINQANSQEVI